MGLAAKRRSGEPTRRCGIRGQVKRRSSEGQAKVKRGSSEVLQALDLEFGEVLRLAPESDALERMVHAEVAEFEAHLRTETKEKKKELFCGFIVLRETTTQYKKHLLSLPSFYSTVHVISLPCCLSKTVQVII